MTTQASVIIVGAGMAGLTCAAYLKKAGINALILEASDGVGGRIRTDVVDGFRLDRGFQILLTAYPEAQRLLDYAALNLKTFRSGALIRCDEPGNTNPWLTLLNPLNEPASLFQTLFSSVGTFGDKLRILELVRRVQGMQSEDFFCQEATTTYDFLTGFGFSDQMIARFFRPFFGGIFLEDALHTSSNFFEFCFSMFYSGEAAIPASGMEQIPAQVAGRLLPEQIRLNTPVKAISGGQVHLENGEILTSSHIVLAVDRARAAALLGKPAPAETAFTHTTCTYFAAPASPRPGEKLLLLNTRRSSAVHNLAVVSDIDPTTAPDGQALISVSTQGLTHVDKPALAAQIQRELTGWFGEPVKEWRHLRTYHIPHALPAYGPDATHEPLKISRSLYQCGDQTAYPSLNAAIRSGRVVAEQISKEYL
ncbi:NAD(P)/FAD-dependent oxidoreductase [Arsenicibacter rosenii]|uniref:Amine oxidase n=1 Tax=Arsenicibacter rosenii TaxID=1750698 RepID=A0A1S2VRR2_9BACT|nr:NAD(P)/FAD-dependent oxidoreductase [Arsenicibacter rosenii]OIN60578.1 amine oxidase [Arsenicibacter rosenii]